MSIFSAIFGGGNNAPANPAPAPANTAPQPGNIPTNPSVTPNPNNPTTPNNSNTAPVDNNNPNPNPSPANPLDNFSSLWAPTDPKDTPAPQPLINIDAKTLADAAKKTDFSKMISPEQLTAIGQGGDAAVQAFAQAMNSVAQGVYAQSAFATTKIVEQAVAKAKEQFTSEIPSHVKKLQVSENLRSENPALSHPAAAPILGALESQFTLKHPTASSAEISKLAKDYLEQFAGAVNAPKELAAKEAQAKQNAQGNTDWNFFLNPNSGS